MKQKSGMTGFMLITLAVVFTLGLVMGTVALKYTPSETISEVIESFEYNRESDFLSLFKKNLIFELMWLVMLWLVGSNSITIPFVSAVISLRGFVMGFSLSFVQEGGFEGMKLFLCNILPQCITALPIMSLFIIKTMQTFAERKYKSNYQTEHILRGVIFSLITMAASAIEALLIIIFERFC